MAPAMARCRLCPAGAQVPANRQARYPPRAHEAGPPGRSRGGRIHPVRAGHGRDLGGRRTGHQPPDRPRGPGYRTTSSRRSRRGSRLRCKPALRATGSGGRASRWMGGSPWWSTTASPPGPRPGPPARSPGRRGGAGSARRARRAAGMAGKDRHPCRRAGLRGDAERVLRHRAVLRRVPQVSDEEVIARLGRAATPQSPAQASTTRAAGGADPPARSEEVEPAPASSAWPAT
jgi:hypothetical protein